MMRAVCSGPVLGSTFSPKYMVNADKAPARASGSIFERNESRLPSMIITVRSSCDAISSAWPNSRPSTIKLATKSEATFRSTSTKPGAQ
ncbi:MAG: hypothetical protein IPG27_21825 [Ottowia sp.]|nr:hypothetical protein [Ottowia sp.]MBK6616615.1 hypothetical protein [Ottowia sp.]